MDLIRNINSPDYFTNLCKALLAAEYTDFQTIDDSGGDGGNDGYSEKEEILFQFFCPKKPEKANNTTYKTKVRKDLDKAKELTDSGLYKIKIWVFITPTELQEEVQTYIRTEAAKRGFVGIAWASPKLKELFSRHSHLRSQFPDLIQPDVEKKVDTVIERLDSAEEAKRQYAAKTERVYARRIDEAKKLLDNHRYISAKKEYEIIKRDIEAETDKVDPHLYFRTYNNLGVAEQAIGNTASAITFFEKAYEAEPTLPMAICTLATAKQLQDCPEEGLKVIEELLAREPNNERAILTKANLMLSLARYSEASSFLRSKGKNAHVFLFEAIGKEEQGDYAGAIRAYEQYITFTPKDAQGYLRGATAILNGTREEIAANELPTHKIPDEVRLKFLKAIEWLKTAITLLHEDENIFEISLAYTNLSACYVALDMSQEALDAITNAVRTDHHSPIPFLNKGVAELRLGKFKDAEASLKKYKDMGGDDPRLMRHLGYAALRTNNLIMAEEVLEAILEKDSHLDLDVAELCLELYSRQLEAERLQTLIERLERDFPNNSHALKIRAENLQRLGSPDAGALFQRALDNAENATERFFAEIAYADYLYEKKEYIHAAEYYEKYIGLARPDPVTRRYAQCLYDSGQYGALLKWIEKVSSKIRKDGLIMQVEAYANWYLGNLEKAANLFKELYAKNPTGTKYVVFYGMCQFRLGKEKEAKAAYDSVKNLVSDAENLAILAGGYEFIGDRKLAIELTFKALENEQNNPQAHLAYIFTFLRREQADGEDFEEKYIKAFQKSIAEFNSRFPEEKALQGFEVKDGDLSHILNTLDQIASYTENATALYRDSQAPLAIIPKMTGKRPFDVWAAFTQMDAIGIKIAFGSPEEIRNENITLQNFKDRNIVVDIYPLFILGHLERLELLTKFFKKIYVHQSVLDELIENIDDRRTSLRKGLTILGKVGDTPQITEIPPEEIQKTLDLLERIRNFITNNPQVEVCGLSAEQKTPMEKDLIDAMHRTTKDSIDLATELKVPLYSDDRTLRALLRFGKKAESFSTQAFAGATYDAGYISLEEQYAIQRKMIDLRYEFLAINGPFIFAQLRQVKFEIEKIKSIVISLAKKETSTESLGMVLSDFCYLLTQTKELPSAQKIEIFKKIITEISKNHDISQIEEATFANLQRKALPENHEKLKTILRQFFAI